MSCKAAIKLGDCMYSMIAHCIADLTDVGPCAVLHLRNLAAAAASEADVSAKACRSLLLLGAFGLLLPCVCSCLLLL